MLNKLRTKRAGFTLVEIMIVVAIIALLAAIAVPSFLRSRKRSQASKIINDLRLIDAAVDQYAIETTKTGGLALNTADWTAYVKKDTALYSTGLDLFGNAYPQQVVDSQPMVSKATFETLSDVANAEFFSPYGVEP
jgi:prepilin-type N-terminal cleavage/methylation domain-containing protein